VQLTGKISLKLNYNSSRLLEYGLLQNQTKFGQLIASLTFVLPQLYLKKLKLECLKFGFQRKNERYKHK